MLENLWEYEIFDKTNHLQSIFIDEIAITTFAVVLKVSVGAHMLIAIVLIFESTSARFAFVCPVIHSLLMLLHGSQ